MVTKRTKNLKKQEIPSLDDPISKLNHIGKETVKKLNELKAAADEASVDLPIPQALWRCAPWDHDRVHRAYVRVVDLAILQALWRCAS